MIVQVLEKLPVFQEPLVKPGAILGAQVLDCLLGHGTVELTHSTSVPAVVSLDERWRGKVATRPR